MWRALLLHFLLQLPINVSSTPFDPKGEICLKVGILTPVSQKGIAQRKSQNVNFNSEKLSTTSNLTSHVLDEVNAKVTSLLGGAFTKPKWVIGNRRIFLTNSVMGKAPFACAAFGAHVFRPTSTADIRKAVEIMTAEGMEYCPVGLKPDRGVFRQLDGTFFSVMTSAQLELNANFSGNLPILKRADGIIAPFPENDRTKSIKVLCESQMTYMRSKDETRPIYNQLLKKITDTIPQVKRVLEFFSTLHESPSSMQNALMGSVFKLKPPQKILNLLSIARQMTQSKAWSNTKLQAVEKLLSWLEGVKSLIPSTSPTKNIPIPIDNMKSFENFLNLPVGNHITNLTITPTTRTTTTDDYIFQSQTHFINQDEKSTLITYKFTPHVLADGKVIDVSYVNVYGSYIFTSDTIPALECADPNNNEFCNFPHPRLDYSRLRCGNFIFDILGHSLGISEGACPLKDVDYPKVARINCNNGQGKPRSDMVLSSAERFTLDVHCNSMNSKLEIFPGIYYSQTSCGMSFNGIPILPQDPKGTHFEVPHFSFPNDNSPQLTTNDILLYSLTALLTVMLLTMLIVITVVKCFRRSPPKPPSTNTSRRPSMSPEELEALMAANQNLAGNNAPPNSPSRRRPSAPQ